MIMGYFGFISRYLFLFGIDERINMDNVVMINVCIIK